MKKIIFAFFTLLLVSGLLISAVAAPSPTTSAVIGEITVETESGKEIIIPTGNAGAYFDIIHVQDAEKGSDLYNIGEQLKKDGRFDDDKLSEVFGEDFDGDKLIQLFTVEKKQYVEGEQLTIGDIVINDDGTFKIENAEVVSVKGGKVTIRLDCPSVNEDMDIRLIRNAKGEWIQAEHTRIFNGYLTFDLDLNQDIGAVWAITVGKAPVSPPTGETSFAVVYLFAFVAALIGTVVVTRKYLAHK